MIRIGHWGERDLGDYPREFKVGDRVKCVRAAYPGHRVENRIGTVREINVQGTRIRVDFDGLGIDPKYSYWRSRFDLITPIVPSDRTRGGHVVSHLETFDGHFTALVAVDDQILRCQFGLDGRFMPGHDNPVDLVGDAP